MVDGPSVQIKLLAEKLVDDGVKVSVLTRRFSAKHPRFEDINGINVRRLSCFGGYFLGHLFFGFECFITLLKYGKRIDVINTHGSVGMAMIGIACGGFLRKTVVSTFHATGLKIVGRVPSMKIPFFGSLLKTTLKRLDAAICVSNAIYEDLRSVQFPKTKIYIIPCAVDTRLFVPVSKETKFVLRNRLGLSEKTLLVFTGRLVYTKGVDILLKALRNVMNSTTNIHLLIVGEGYPKSISAEEELRKYVEDHDLCQYVTFTGNVNNVYEYLQASDIFAFPSRWEGLPTSLLEAMSCCLPVVATNVGGIPDAVEGGVDGFVFPVNDYNELARKILMIKNDVDLAERIGRNAREKVKKMFSIEVVAKSYSELYRKILHKKGPTI
jgi:glycosyltransferase involved in cell wall biosynthesis